jgi:hypothetical protein
MRLHVEQMSVMRLHVEQMLLVCPAPVGNNRSIDSSRSINSSRSIDLTFYIILPVIHFCINLRSTSSMPPDGAPITPMWPRWPSLFHNFLFCPWRRSRNFAAPIFLRQDGFWEPGETRPTGLFSLLVTLIIILLRHTSFWTNLAFLVRQERDHMPRHIVCSWRCLVTILGLPLVLYLYSIWTSFVYGFNSHIRDISHHF